MSEIIKLQNKNSKDEQSDNIIVRNEQLLAEKTSGMLADVSAEMIRNQSLSMPIAQLATLGAGVSSLLPALRTVTQTTTITTDGLYRVANAVAGDVLKTNAAGTVTYGALKTASGASKMAQLTEVGAISATSEAVTAINPAVMMMAVALFSIEQKLGEIAETQKQILSFLENIQESDIEADLQTISKIIAEYKYNWDNERYIASNHKMVLDIQRNARKNMNSYKKSVSELVAVKKLIVVQNKVNAAKENLIQKFKYYRLALFTYAMASLLVVMLSGNFKEEYISDIKTELEAMSMEYRDMFTKCSERLEELGKISVEAKVLKGSGMMIDSAGKLIEKIPVIERGHVDEFLRESGSKMQKNGEKKEYDAVGQFAAVSNPGIRVFIEKLDDMIHIYNHTEAIYFDDKKIYLVAG